MPGTTSPDNIVYPLPTDPIAPLNAVFQDMAESVQDALDAVDLNKLADVVVPSPSTNDLLQFDGADWVNVGVNTALGAGKILQVVSTAKTDTFSMSSTTFADITALTASITPSSTSSKILIVATVVFSANGNVTTGSLRLARGGTGIALGDTAGSRTSATSGRISMDQSQAQSIGLSFVDSPSSVSSLTYSVQARSESTNAVFVNRTSLDTDSALFIRGVSTITLMEVAG